jgi:NADH-quinone oxidoreductase subunit L
MSGVTSELSRAWPVAHAWLIPAIPLLSATVVLLVLRPISTRLSGILATGAVLASAVLSWALAAALLSEPGGAEAAGALVAGSVDWIAFRPGLVARMGVLIDPLSALLMVVVSTVSLLVHVYSTGYMRGEPGYGRYFGFLNLFTGAMLGLVVSTNLFQIYAFWELVGASSFLLIGFHYDRPSAVAASKKAFIVTRLADLGFLLGILLLGYLSVSLLGADDPLDFSTLTRDATLAKLRALEPLFLGVPPLALAALLVFVGAAGKSAMFPLHVWLPDAMEGPTPVSALIHAATMVVAGVYLVARMFPLFAAAPPALEVVAVVGAFTCLFAAVIACTQDDLKRVLAFSTLSQIGYMMLALGVAGAHAPEGHAASLFHLTTHALFKALLFLCAGSVIHALHTNDVWRMGGLAHRMPLTHLTFLVAVLSIAGVPPFAGFFSKDAILVAALSSGHRAVFGVGLAVAGLTAFYMGRVYLLVFRGAPRDTQAFEHAHESPPSMTIPLAALAVLSLGSGFLPLEGWVGGGAERAAAAGEGARHAVAAAGTLLGAAGLLVAWLVYGRRAAVEGALARSPLYRTVKAKLYVDEAYLWVTHRVLFRLVAAPVAWFDRRVVDGAVNLSARVTEAAGRGLGALQSGQVQVYGAWLVSGTVALALFVWSISRWA